MDTLATEVCKSLPICAKPGKYISIENGPRAVKEPKISINLMYFIFVILMAVSRIKLFIFANVKNKSLIKLHLNQI